MDERTKKNLKTLDPKVQPRFTAFIEDAQALAATVSCEYKAISGNRTWKEQDALFAQGRTKPGDIVTNAKGGQSNHNFGIALDFGVFKGTKYLDGSKLKSDKALASAVHRMVAEKVAAKHKIEWGGNWTSIKDEPHFEFPTGLTMAQKRARFEKHGSVIV